MLLTLLLLAQTVSEPAKTAKPLPPPVITAEQQIDFLKAWNALLRAQAAFQTVMSTITDAPKKAGCDVAQDPATTLLIVVCPPPADAAATTTSARPTNPR